MLVASGKIFDGPVYRWKLYLQLLDVLVDFTPLFSLGKDSVGLYLVKRSSDSVPRDRLVEEKSLLLSVLSQKTKPMIYRIGWVFDFDFLSVLEDPPVLFLRNSEYCLRRLCTPRSDETREPKHFAPPDAETHILYERVVGKPFHIETDIADLCMTLRINLYQRTPDYIRYDLVHIHGLHILYVRDVLAVPEYRRIIPYLLDLLHPVGDVDERDTFFLHRVDD